MARSCRPLLHHDFAKGWTQAYSLDQQSAEQTADFLIYSSLTTVARRPGTDASWTQNWPFEPLVGNTPTTSTFRWTWISFCFTFFAFGAVMFIYQRYLNDPDKAPMDPVLARFRPLTASQRRIGKYFLVVAGVLLLQILVGSIMAHYYTDRASFYGIEIDRFLPFNFLRDVHIQSPIVWIGLSWIGAALFLAPAISGGEPKGQGFLVDVLFWVTLFIVVGALVGNYLGIMGYIGEGWFWFGNQGLSYIQLGRAWQIGFFAGLAIWSILVFRALWPTRTTLFQATRQFWSGRIRLEHLIWASTVNIALLYVFGMIPLTGIEKSFTISDFWRWWVVHLWVEQSFEFFAAAISAYLLMAVGLVSRQLAERSVYFELILIFLGGVLGTGHHLYWAGEPGLWVPMGTMFSFIEVLPLVLLVMEAIQHRRLIKADQEFKYGLAYTYIIGAAFWNFVGAGVFGGGTLNAPLVNYYEHGTFLTLNHAHTALVRRLRPAGDRADLFLPALRRGRPASLRRAARAVGVLALQLGPGPVDRVQLLPDRLAATRCRLRAWPRLCAKPGVLRHDPLLAMDAVSGRCGVRARRAADGVGFHHQAAAALPALRRAADPGLSRAARALPAVRDEHRRRRRGESRPRRHFSPRASGRSFSRRGSGRRRRWRLDRHVRHRSRRCRAGSIRSLGISTRCCSAS